MGIKDLYIPSDSELAKLETEYPDIPRVMLERGVVSPKGTWLPVPIQARILLRHMERPDIASRDLLKEIPDAGNPTTIQSLISRARKAGVVMTPAPLAAQQIQHLKKTEDSRMMREAREKEKKRDANAEIADKQEAIARAAADELLARDFSGEKAEVVAKIMATAVDKMRLLRDEATKTVMSRTHSLVEHVAYVNTVPLERQIAIAEGKESLVGRDIEPEDAMVVPPPPTRKVDV